LNRRITTSQQMSERIEQMIEALAHREGPSLTQLGLRKIVIQLLEAEVSERPGPWLRRAIRLPPRCGSGSAGV